MVVTTLSMEILSGKINLVLPDPSCHLVTNRVTSATQSILGDVLSLLLVVVLFSSFSTSKPEFLKALSRYNFLQNVSVGQARIKTKMIEEEQQLNPRPSK